MLKSNVVTNCVLPNGVGVKSIRKTDNEDVYCLVTKENGNFIANSIVVKNCDALRYVIYTHFFGKEGSRLSAQDLDRMYLEAIGGDRCLPAQFQQPDPYYAR